jgi:hypothetical protein
MDMPDLDVESAILWLEKAVMEALILLHLLRRPGPVQDDEEPLLCPDTLDAMLQIVSNVRQGRMDILRDNQIAAARTFQDAEEVDEEEEGLTESEGSQFPSLPTEFMGLMPRRG